MYEIIISILVFIGVLIWNHYNIKNNPSTLNDSDISLSKDIDINIKNKKLIETELGKTLSERMDLLKSEKMTFREWLEYNNKNMFVKVNGGGYYIFIHEHIKDKNFICRVHANAKYPNLLWSDIIKEQNEQFISTKFTCDPELLFNMFNSGQHDIPDIMSYYWNDPVTNKLIKKQTLFLSYSKPHKDKSGLEHNGFVIGVGYNIENLNITYQNKYYNKLNKFYLGTVIIVVLSLALLMSRFNIIASHGNIKSISFLIVSLLYILYYTNSIENLSSPVGEKDKMDSINSGILSISFLIGVNIFIISTLQYSKSSIKLNQETSVIFSVSLLLLMFSIFKITNYSSIDDLVDIRVSNQFVFNYSIILNILIIVNYLLFIYFFGHELTKSEGKKEYLHAI
jgi:hypothetical protein